MFNKQSRQSVLSSVENSVYDLIIVGGGITGAGVARDAASRGLKVLLAEARDFASGTSSRSSKLVHGGIRYLENFEFGLVFEALSERKILLETAPHMVKPLRFVIPVYDTSRVGLFKMEMGMILYDLLSLFEAPKTHEFHLKESTQQLEPLLRQDGLSGSVVYSDAFMEDDRLVLETLRSAVRGGAECVNYTEVSRVAETGSVCEVELKDALTGKTFSARGRHVVGCVGPWTDLFGSQALKNWQPVLRPTKGIHLVFPRRRLPIQQAVVMAAEERIVFVIPRDEVVIVGTTDTDFKKDPGDVNTDSEDVRYLLRITNKYFPSMHLTPLDVISCYSGVRPLVKDDAQSTGKTSREHQIFNPSPSVTVVAGGKYTTYRAMARQIVDSVLKNWTFEERMTLQASKTKDALNPRATSEKIERLVLQAAEVGADYGVPPQLVTDLALRHGDEAFWVLNYMRLLDPHQTKNLAELRWAAEAKFSIDHEMCLNLIDFYWRRSPLFLFHEDNGLRFLRSLASVFAAAFEWSQEEEDRQIQSVVELMAKEKQSLYDLTAAH